MSAGNADSHCYLDEITQLIKETITADTKYGAMKIDICSQTIFIGILGFFHPAQGIGNRFDTCTLFGILSCQRSSFRLDGHAQLRKFTQELQRWPGMKRPTKNIRVKHIP